MPGEMVVVGVVYDDIPYPLEPGTLSSSSLHPL